MNATEARKKALSVEAEKVKQQYQSIKKLIDKAVDEGKCYTYGYGGKPLLEGTKIKLEEEGFDIKQTFDIRNEDLITIKW